MGAIIKKIKKKQKLPDNLFSVYNLISTQLGEIVTHKNQGDIKKYKNWDTIKKIELGNATKKILINTTIINKITLMAVTL